MTHEQRAAYEWAKNQNYTSVAAQYAKRLAEAIDTIQAERDAAVRDLEEILKKEQWGRYCRDYCGKYTGITPCIFNNDGDCNPKWRGAQK